MPAIQGVDRSIVDDDRIAVLPDLMADRGLYLQLVARPQAELDAVLHGAGDPPCLGDAGDRGKAHARGAAYDIEDWRHDRDPCHGLDLGSMIHRRCGSSSA
jgi:hypothetical protein